MPAPDPQRDWEGGCGSAKLAALLEHFADPTPLLRSMIRVSKRGGLFSSDVVPLKSSLARSVWYLRGLYKTVDDEHPDGRDDLEGWMRACRLEDVRVYSSAVAPPLGFYLAVGRTPIRNDGP